MRGLVIGSALLVLAGMPLARAQDGRVKDVLGSGADAQQPAPPPSGSDSRALELEIQLRESQRDLERGARERQLERDGSHADVGRYRVREDQRDRTSEISETLDRQALERRSGAPADPDARQIRDLERTLERLDREKRTGLIDAQIRAREAARPDAR
jgi:hypothetical protein